ncbi:MAG: ATP-binding protein [Rhodothermales bacterium]
MRIPAQHLLSTCLLWILASLAPIGRQAGAQDTTAFHTIGTDEGLSHNTAVSLEITARGEVWVGTLRGLNRYEGTRVVSYFSVSNDSRSLPAFRVDAIKETSAGDLWVGLSGGFAKYSAQTNDFDRFELDTPFPPIVHDIEEGPDGILYLATWTDGLIKFDPATGASERVFKVPHAQLDGPTQDGLTIREITFTDQGTAWVSSYTGVYTFHADSGTLGHPAWPTATLDRLARIQSLSVLDLEQVVLFASLNGVVAVDKETGRAVDYLIHPDPRNDWNYVGDMKQASDGSIWLATGGGVARWVLNESRIDRLVPSSQTGALLDTGRTFALELDDIGDVWVGTSRAGLLQMDRTSYPVPRVETGNTEDRSLPDGHVWAAAAGSPTENGFWLGMPEAFGFWDAQTNTFQETRFGGLGASGVSAIHTQGDGTYILATRRHGVCRFNPATRACGSLFKTAGTIYAIARTPDGDLWFALFGHLYRYTPETGLRRDYIGALGGLGSAVPLVMALHVDKNGVLWVGMEYGLAKYDAASDTFVPEATQQDRLVVSGIHEAGDGRLWLSGNDIFLYDPATRTLTPRSLRPGELSTGQLTAAVTDLHGTLWVDMGSYLLALEADGVRETGRIPLATVRRNVDFTTSAAIRAPDGRVLFGYQGGFHIFDPESDYTPKRDSRVSIVSYTANGQEHRLLGGETVHVDHGTRVISFTFATTGYLPPSERAFEIRLDGFESEWRAVRSSDVTYTNLPPGLFTLHVRRMGLIPGSDVAGTTVTIQVAPPWWSRPWFILLVAVSGIALLVGVVKWRERDLVQRGDMLNALVVQRTAELAEKADELQRANELKSRFFSNVSHELRTPLTLIKGYLEDAESTAPDPRLQRAIGLSERLDALVSQLLDLARSDGKRQKLEAADADLVAFTHRIVSHFSHAARKKGIDLTFEHDQAALWSRFDAIKMDQILSNLIGNALKFTSSGGSIWVILNAVEERTVRLTVADSGEGIPPTLVDRVFERFFQVDDELTRTHEGLGIGLALTRDFVELHGGRISVQSEVGSGSVFTAEFPQMLLHEGLAASHALYHDLSEYEPGLSGPKKKLLVVEDNAELRGVLARQLSVDFDVSTAADGREGWSFIRSNEVDLVLSDVMMPGMSGLDLLREVRASEAHAHLPFVLLTARSGEDAQVEGLTALADDFVAKPYSSRVLKARLLNLAQRGRAIAPAAAAAAAAQHPLLIQIHAYVLEHMADTDVSVQDVADAVFMSPRTFQRHVKEITGESAASHIRSVRLEHARELLEEGHLSSVSEAAHRTGFANVSHFSKVFEETYGLNPKSYMS